MADDEGGGEEDDDAYVEERKKKKEEGKGGKKKKKDKKPKLSEEEKKEQEEAAKPGSWCQKVAARLLVTAGHASGRSPGLLRPGAAHPESHTRTATLQHPHS